VDFHPVAKIFDLMKDSEIGELAEDIKANGLHEPIWTYGGQILDGRNRWLACGRAGVEPVFREYTGDESGLIQFSLSLNLHRRHLSESQRALIGARVANMRQGSRTDLASIEAMSQAQAAELLNVSRSSVQRAGKLLECGALELVAAVQSGAVSVSSASAVSSLGADEQTQIAMAGRRAILAAAEKIRFREHEARRVDRIYDIATKCRAGTPGLPEERYAVILADPPWRYEYSASVARDIENQYPTMTLDEICAVPVGDIANEDAVLFLWATSPKLEESLRVMREWGFEYRTCMVWVKDKIGMGYYARQRHELLLIGKRGEPPMPEPSARPDSVIEAVRVGHSLKPRVVHDVIERMYPEFPRVELFARVPVDGWAVWGNEV